MRKSILDNPVSRVSAPLLSLLLLILLTIGTVNAGSGSKNHRIDAAKDMVIRHMDQMKQRFPEIEGTVLQTERALNDGMMFPRKTCSNCHLDE